MKEYNFEGNLIKVGQNASENTFLVKNSDPSYIWVHLESFPSCHVIIETSEPSPATISYAMNICLQNSKYKDIKYIKASVTKVSNLKCTESLGVVEFKSNRQVSSFFTK